MKKDKYKAIYYSCCIVYGLFLAYAFYDNFTKGYTHSLMMVYVSLALAFVAPVLFKLMKWKPVYEIYILALVFMFLASTLGSAYRFYDHVLYWDKFVHCVSGVLGLLASYLLFCSLKKTTNVKKEDRIIMYVFINACNMSIAVLWELYEYATLVLFNYDAIRHYSTGVHDSMTDIIVCIIGGLFATYFIYRYYKTGKDNIFTNVYKKFYIANSKNAKKSVSK